MTWWHALVAAGAVPAAFTPSTNALTSYGGEPGSDAGADIVEDDDVQVHAVAPHSGLRASFLDGFGRWRVVAYDRHVPIVDAYVAAAVRRRDASGSLRTTHELSRAFAVAPLDQLDGALRARLHSVMPDVETVSGDHLGEPSRLLETVETAVRRARAALERELAEAALASLQVDEWLVGDGLLSRSTAVARHPRAIGVIRSHGTQFLEGRGLERALTLPAGHRTSVFRVRGGHTRTEVYSWYLRLWPWEGNNLLHGLLRVEARAHDETVARASELSGWLLAERAPLASPDARWDRLLYPLQCVEEYLKSRSRLLRTGT